MGLLSEATDEAREGEWAYKYVEYIMLAFGLGNVVSPNTARIGMREEKEKRKKKKK